jgi:hypothetical protein
MRARSAARASPRLLGIASAACFGARPLGLACVAPSCLHLPGAGVPTQVEELSSPLLCAPARRPAHLLGYFASPRLGCLLPRLPASGHRAPLATCSLATWPCLRTPAACTGAGAPAPGTSYWGHPLSESNALSWALNKKATGGCRSGAGHGRPGRHHTFCRHMRASTYPRDP